MKHPEKVYIDHYPYLDGDQDISVRNRLIKRVLTRSPHDCISPVGGVHEIPPGTQAVRETAFVEGAPSRCYVCCECIEKWIEQEEILGAE